VGVSQSVPERIATGVLSKKYVKPFVWFFFVSVEMSAFEERLSKN